MNEKEKPTENSLENTSYFNESRNLNVGSAAVVKVR